MGGLIGMLGVKGIVAAVVGIAVAALLVGLRIVTAERDTARADLQVERQAKELLQQAMATQNDAIDGMQAKSKQALADAKAAAARVQPLIVTREHQVTVFKDAELKPLVPGSDCHAAADDVRAVLGGAK